MAKIRGIFQFTGKIGEAVGMKGDDGQNYARVRVREIANPNTEAQQNTRTVASLAGKISSLTPAELLKGMRGSNKRQRRSAFMKNIMVKAETTKTSEGIQATLKPEDLILSEGQAAAMPTLGASIALGVVSVTHADWPEDLASVIIVAYGSTDTDRDYVECRHAVILPTDQSPATIKMSQNVTGATIYAIPVMRAVGASSTKYEEALEALETDREFAVNSTSATASALSFQQSVYVNGVEQGQA